MKTASCETPVKMSFEIKNKNALVTGGASGIGFEIVKALFKNGLAKCAILDVKEENGQSAVKEISQKYGENRAIFIKTDVTNGDQFEGAFKETINQFRQLDIVVNNAGILADNNWELTFAVNLGGVIRGTLLALKYMGRDNGANGGVLVNVSSICGLDSFASLPIYVSSKHAVFGLSRSFGKPYYYNRSGVTVLTLCPGVTSTEMVKKINKDLLYDYPDFHKELQNELLTLSSQTPEFVASSLVTIIKTGENGSAWVVEGGEPPYEIEVKPRQERRKN